MIVQNRFHEWTDMMRAANRGDGGAYARLLGELTPYLRRVARLGFKRSGLGPDDVEDVVQDTLLAVHLKRHTWREDQPLAPWVRAIAGNKLIDNLRRRGRRVQISVDELEESAFASVDPSPTDGIDAERMLAALGPRQRQIVQSISIEGRSAREVGDALGLSEGAVRVALHRALKALSAAHREEG